MADTAAIDSATFLERRRRSGHSVVTYEVPSKPATTRLPPFAWVQFLLKNSRLPERISYQLKLPKDRNPDSSASDSRPCCVGDWVKRTSSRAADKIRQR